MEDYGRFFSDDVPAFMPSPTRELFKKVDISKIYSLAGGFPSPDTFPTAEMARIVSEVMETYGAKAMQYGGTQGVPELVEEICRRTGEAPQCIQVTTSSQQGIDVCGRVFLNPGDVVLTESPTYLGAIQSFRDYRASFRALDEFRADPGSCGKVKFAYVIPDFGNPSGATMTLEQRQELVDLARRGDFLIVEDSPYRALRYEGTDVPTIRSLAPERTIHLCSFSKIFAPAFRLGWMEAPEEIIQKVYICKQALDLCPPVFDQYLAYNWMSSGRLDANLAKAKALYSSKRDILLDELEKEMPSGATWTHPQGGLFIFVTLPEGCDTLAMYDQAISSGIAYVPGSFFFTDGSHRNTMRLNFSYIDSDKIGPAVKLLAAFVRKMMGND